MEKPNIPQPPRRVAICLTIVVATVGAVVGAIVGTCYPSWGSATPWQRVDNAFFGAMLSCLVLGLAVYFSAVIVLAQALGMATWGLLVEAPIALAFGFVLPEPVPPIGRITLSVAYGVMLVRWWFTWESRDHDVT